MAKQESMQSLADLSDILCGAEPALGSADMLDVPSDASLEFGKKKKRRKESREESPSWKAAFSLATVARRSTSSIKFAGAANGTAQQPHAPSPHTSGLESLFADMEATGELDMAVPSRSKSGSRLASSNSILLSPRSRDDVDLLISRKTFIGATKVGLLEDDPAGGRTLLPSSYNTERLPTVVIVGPSGVGKTAIADEFFAVASEEIFLPPGVEACHPDMRYGNTRIDNFDVTFRVLCCTDLPTIALGSEVAFVVVYDVVDDEALSAAMETVETIQMTFAAKEAGVHLVAHRIDLLGKGDVNMFRAFEKALEACRELGCKFLPTTTRFNKTNAAEVIPCALLDACIDLSPPENVFIFFDGHCIAIEDYMWALEDDVWVRRYCAVKGEFLIQVDSNGVYITYLGVCMPKRLGTFKGRVAWLLRLPGGQKLTFGTDTPEQMNQWVDVSTRCKTAEMLDEAPNSAMEEFSSMVNIAGSIACIDCSAIGCEWVSHQHKVFICTACAKAHKEILGAAAAVDLESYKAQPMYWSCLYAQCNEHFNMLWQAKKPEGIVAYASDEERLAYVRDKYRGRLFYDCRPDAVQLKPSGAASLITDWDADACPGFGQEQDAEADWKERYIYLSPVGLLTIYKDAERNILLDTFHISCTSVVEGRKLGLSDEHLQVIGPHSGYILLADSADTAWYWLTVLSSATVRNKGRSNVIALESKSLPAAVTNRRAAPAIDLSTDGLEEALSLDRVYSLLQHKMSLWNTRSLYREALAKKQLLELQLKETIRQLQETDETEQKILNRVAKLEPTAVKRDIAELRVASRKEYMGTRRGSVPGSPARRCMTGPTIPAISFHGNIVRSASLQQLVELLVHVSYTEENFCTTFLTTFPEFTTSDEFLKLLCTRFANPALMSIKEEEGHVAGHIVPITSPSQSHAQRVKALKVLERWVRQFWQSDFLTNNRLIVMLMAFLDEIVDPLLTFIDHLEVLRDLVKAKLEQSIGPELLGSSPPSRRSSFSESAPRPILPKHALKEDLTAVELFFELDTVELARQLALSSHDLFSRICSRELLNKGWTSKRKAVCSANVVALTQNFNDITAWVCASILGLSRYRQRAKAVESCILLAAKCHELNNFHALLAIVGGLQDTSVRRLAKTWAQVPSKAVATLKELSAIVAVDDNWAIYRTAMANLAPDVPVVPFIGVFLKDLVFIEDGVSSGATTAEPSLINFNKQRMVREVIRQVQQRQQMAYDLIPLPQVGALLKGLDVAEGMKTEQGRFELSSSLEQKAPLKRKDTLDGRQRRSPSETM